MKWEIQKCEPISYSWGFGCPGWKPIKTPNYAKSERGEELRRIRVFNRTTLGLASRQVGLTVEQVSGLERGRYTLPDDQWEELFAALGRST